MQKQEIKSKRRSRELEGPSSWREHRAMISHHGRQHRQVSVLSILARQLIHLLCYNLSSCCYFEWNKRSETLLSTFSGPQREAWLWRPSFSHWRLLPRQSATQSHLHFAVIVSTCTHMQHDVFHLPSLFIQRCCVYRQAQHVRNVAEELDPTFQARRQETESLSVGQAGTVNKNHGSQNETVRTIAEHSYHFPFDIGSTGQSLPAPHDFLEEPTFIPPTKRQTDKSGRCKPKEKKENCKQQ